MKRNRRFYAGLVMMIAGAIFMLSTIGSGSPATGIGLAVVGIALLAGSKRRSKDTQE